MENIGDLQKEKMGWLIDSKIFSCPLFDHFNSLEKFWQNRPENYSKVLALLSDLKCKESMERESFFESYSDEDHIPWHSYEYNNSLDDLEYSIKNNLTLYTYQQGLIRLGIHGKQLFAEGFNESLKKNFKTLKLIANYLDLDYKSQEGFHQHFTGSYIINKEDLKNHFPKFSVDFLQNVLTDDKNEYIILNYGMLYDSFDEKRLEKELPSSLILSASIGTNPHKTYEILEKDNLPKVLLKEIISKYYVSFLSDSDIQKIRDENYINY